MHDWRLPKVVRNSYLRGVVKVSPGNAATKKKSLKGEVIYVGILHKHYQWQATDEEKRMVKLDFRFGLPKCDMQRQEGEKKVSLLSQLENSEQEMKKKKKPT